MRRSTALLAFLLLSCGDSATPDAGRGDAGAGRDAGGVDAGAADAGVGTDDGTAVDPARSVGSAGGGGVSRPLIDDTAGLGIADIALLELIHDKITWEKTKEA